MIASLFVSNITSSSRGESMARLSKVATPKRPVERSPRLEKLERWKEQNKSLATLLVSEVEYHVHLRYILMTTS